MRRGEIWWARIPMRGSDAKRRPMLVVSDDAFNANDRYLKVMAVHLTSAVRWASGFDWEVPVPKGAAGLHHASIIKCAEIYTLWKTQLDGPIGTLPHACMLQVDRALAVALSLRLAEEPN